MSSSHPRQIRPHPSTYTDSSMVICASQPGLAQMVVSEV